MRKYFDFPNPVNEISARLVAAGVVAMCVAVLALHQYWVIACIAYGFVARVAAGPRFSPLGRFVTQVLTPALPFQEKLVPGPPKRFAQGIGATLSLGAAASFFIAGNTTVALVMIGMIAIAATLEAAIGFCLGCVIFRWLMDRGVIPETTCEACSNLDLRRPVMVP